MSAGSMSKSAKTNNNSEYEEIDIYWEKCNSDCRTAAIIINTINFIF